MSRATQVAFCSALRPSCCINRSSWGTTDTQAPWAELSGPWSLWRSLQQRYELDAEIFSGRLPGEIAHRVGDSIVITANQFTVSRLGEETRFEVPVRATKKLFSPLRLTRRLMRTVARTIVFYTQRQSDKGGGTRAMHGRPFRPADWQ